MRLSRHILGITVAVAVALPLAPAALASPAASPPRPAHVVRTSGVRDNFTRFCGSSWVKVHIPETSYYNVYNAPAAQAYTCLTAERHHLWFVIDSISYRGAWGDPNISSGWEAGKYSCTGVSGKCFKYPVEEEHDGNPVTSVATWLNPGVYNASYDIWFNTTSAHPVQDNGTEIMIWIAHPGIDDSRAFTRYVTIDGMRFGVMDWMAFNRRAGVWWHYVAFVSLHQHHEVFGMRLNPFFANAIAYGELSAHWWLTGIDFGFELVSGGVGSNVHFYKLTGVS